MADEESLSTTQLIYRIACSANRKARLISTPPWLLRLMALPIGQQEMIRRLDASLLINTLHTQQTLGWQPRFTINEEVRSTVESLMTST